MRINHPRPQLGRQRDLGIEFTDGVAIVESLHPERELALRLHGYAIEADPEVEVPFQDAIGEPIIDLEKLTRAQLRDMLPEDTDVSSKATHAELVDAVSSLPAASIPGSLDNGDGSFTHPGFGTVELADGTAVGDGESLSTIPVAPAEA